VTLGLFTGSSVKTLQFNNQAVNQMEQKDYDYLASFSYKSDILFKEEGQQNINNNYEELTADGTIGTSFSKFFQSFQIDIANFKANNDFAYDTQQTVTQSLKSSYDKMVKVDPDEEMLNLMKFQAAYEANAKLATVLQDMISTTLNMVSR
jgi:flagellar hook-associated protein 1 FlgK